MEKSKELVKKAGIIPELKLAIKLEGGGTKSTGPHTVKVLDEKVIMGTEYMTSKEREEMKYILEENGEKKSYRVPIKDKNGELHYLIQRFAEVEQGEEIILEAKHQGGRTFISLERLNPTVPDDSDIPIIDEQEQITNGDGEIDTGIPMEDPQ